MLSISEAVYSFVTVGDQVTLNNATVTNLNPGLTNLLMTSVEIHVFVAAAGSGANFEYANRLLPRPLGTANNPLSDWRIVGPFKHNVMTEIAGSSITLEFTEYGSEDKEVLILRNESGVPKDVTFVSRVKYIVNRG